MSKAAQTQTPNWSSSSSTSRTPRFCRSASRSNHALLQPECGRARCLRSGIEVLDPGSRKAQTASFLTLVSWGRWIWAPQSDGACRNTMNMSFIYAVTYLMVTSLRSYKKLTCLICCSNSYFSKKTGINIDVNVFNVIPVTNATPYHELSHDQNHLKYVRKI